MERGSPSPRVNDHNRTEAAGKPRVAKPAVASDAQRWSPDRAGISTFLKPIGTVHLFAEDRSATEPAVVLAIFIREGGTMLTTYH
jgi:hypothetical protein